MTDYDKLSNIDFLPGLATPDLLGKAKVIQSLLEESFFHPSGLFYSILLIDSPRHVRPMARVDMEGISDTAVEGYADAETSEAARNEGMTFENSITSAGNYLQAQTARFAATAEPAAYAQAVRALDSLRMIYDHGREHGRAGWLGLYRFRGIVAAAERRTIDEMLRDIADFMTRRNCQRLLHKARRSLGGQPLPIHR